LQCGGGLPLWLPKGTASLRRKLETSSYRVVLRLSEICDDAAHWCKRIIRHLDIGKNTEPDSFQPTKHTKRR